MGTSHLKVRIYDVHFDRKLPIFQGNLLPLSHSAMNKKIPGSIPVGWCIYIPYTNKRV